MILTHKFQIHVNNASDLVLRVLAHGGEVHDAQVEERTPHEGVEGREEVVVEPPWPILQAHAAEVEAVQDVHEQDGQVEKQHGLERGGQLLQEVAQPRVAAAEGSQAGREGCAREERARQWLQQRKLTNKIQYYKIYVSASHGFNLNSLKTADNNFYC